jgi:polyphosphate kinase 2 (PPK2 family)
MQDEQYYKEKDGVRRLRRKFYEKELDSLQVELVKLQYWIKEKGLKLVVLFEGVTRPVRASSLELYPSPAQYNPV